MSGTKNVRHENRLRPEFPCTRFSGTRIVWHKIVWHQIVWQLPMEGMLDESAGPGVTPITQKLEPARSAKRKNKRKPDLKDCLCAEARLHKYTDTRIHKYTNTQIHKNTNTDIYKGHAQEQVEATSQRLPSVQQL